MKRSPFRKCPSSMHGLRHTKCNECSNNKIPYMSMNLTNCGHIFLERGGYSFQPILKRVKEFLPFKNV